MNLILPEIVAIGIYNTQTAVKNRTVSKKRKVSMFELEIPIEKGGDAYINSDKMHIQPDMVICAKPGQTRYTKLPFKCYYIHMIIQEGILYDTLLDIPNFVKTDKYENYFALFEKMCKYYDTKLENDEIILHSLVLEFVYLLINDSKKLLLRERVKQNNYVAIEKSIQYINDNLPEDLSLNTIAEYVGYSPIYFHNIFKASTGKTLREYVEEKRIKKAVNLLITTNETLTKIAYECGFSSQSHFNYAFKRKMKFTPREYMKQVFERYESDL